MVTASHNPPQDNGYKVYLGDGSQIVPPADAEIAARIAAVGPLADVPRGDARQGPRRTTRRPLHRRRRRPDRRRAARPDHGLHPAARGRRHAVSQVLETAGFDPPSVVGAGAARPDFPTLAFPNPEEPGAMDRDGPGRGASRRPGHRQRPGRRPLRRRRPERTAGGCCAATRSARCWPTTCSRRASRRLRLHDRVLDAARQDGRGCTASRTRRRSPGSSGSAGCRGWRSATRRRWATASTPSTWGTRTASRRCAPVRAGRGAEGRRAAPDRRPRRDRPEHGLHATDQLSVRVDRPLADRAPRWPGCGQPADHAGRPRRRHGRRPVPRVGRPAPHRRPALPAGRRRAGHRPAERHRAEAEVLPRGRHPRATRTTASTPPASPPPAASTRSRATLARPGHLTTIAG